MKLPCFILFILTGVDLLSVPIAPGSVAGRVFHYRGGRASLRSVADVTIVLAADGHYHYGKFATGSLIDPLRTMTRTLRSPPVDGTYTYVRTGDAVATLTLSDPTGTLISGSGTIVDEPTTMLAFMLDFSAIGTLERADSSGLFSALQAIGEFWFTDVADVTSAPLANTSVRGQTSTDRPLIMGFIVTGNYQRDFLIRVTGPSLASFGVSGVWADPEFVVYRSDGKAAEVGAYHNDWSLTATSAAEIRKMSVSAGAFGLLEGSKDAVSAVRLPPGAYTIVARPSGGNPGGETLIELYTQP